jgi:hypothetical protein
MKHLILLFALISGIASAQSRSTIMPPTMLRVSYGDSSIEYNLPYQYANSNDFQVLVYPSHTCPVPPQVSILARYDGNQNWYSLPVDQGGVFRHNGFKLKALKLLFKQYHYQFEDCQMSVTGQISG